MHISSCCNQKTEDNHLAITKAREAQKAGRSHCGADVKHFTSVCTVNMTALNDVIHVSKKKVSKENKIHKQS